MPSPLPTAPADIEERINRLARLQGSDQGLFVLAVHSFVEAYIRENCIIDDPADDRFYTILDIFKDELRRRSNNEYIPGLDVLGLLSRSHDLTNHVRHRFAPLATETARASTQHLVRFCALAEIEGGDALRKVKEYLVAWDERRSTGELVKALVDTGFKLQLEKDHAKKLTGRVGELESIEAQFNLFKEQRRAIDLKIVEYENGKAAKDERIDNLRQERNRLTEELKILQKRSDEFDDAKDYKQTLIQMTVYTRTRLDYERMVTRLTLEQKKVLSQISLNEDFLVKGSAGTGKTLVLLKAIEKAKGIGTGGSGAQDELGIEEIRGSVALLTYTTTLVKYDKYLSTIMIRDRLGESDRISTADSFLLERLRAIEPEATIDFSGKLIQELATRYAPAGFDPKDLASEADNFIWANDITKSEYETEMIERKGMKKPILRTIRSSVWTAVEAMSAELEAKGRFSRNYAALKLARHASSGAADKSISVVDYVFVDEAQDLPAVMLKALKACAHRCIVLAGDADQSIYQPGFSFRRAGIAISGRSRILRTNFRNTIQIHELAERYRTFGPGCDAENQPEAFRNGPYPELFQAPDRSSLCDILIDRLKLFARTLGYDNDNLCVLVPLNGDIAFVRDRLAGAGFPVADIKEKDFAFASTGSIRISTLHSAKGLDFPVVLLFLYRAPYFGSDYDEASVDRMTRNLVYVSATRAMDHLNVFALNEPHNPAIAGMVHAFTQGRQP
jgi:hypothetical protein